MLNRVCLCTVVAATAENTNSESLHSDTDSGFSALIIAILSCITRFLCQACAALCESKGLMLCMPCAGQ